MSEKANKKRENERKRGENYSKFDKDVVLNLVTARKDIIENKKTDGASNAEKEAAWEDLAVEFNALTGNNRTSTSLKILWTNMKRSSRSYNAERPIKIRKTGSLDHAEDGQLEGTLRILQESGRRHDNDAEYICDELPVESESESKWNPVHLSQPLVIPVSPVLCQSPGSSGQSSPTTQKTPNHEETPKWFSRRRSSKADVLSKAASHADIERQEAHKLFLLKEALLKKELELMDINLRTARINEESARVKLEQLKSINNLT